MILKLDDLTDTAQSREGFAFAFDAIRGVGGRAGFGILGNSCEAGGGKDDYFRQVRGWHDSGRIELWCHGYDHRPGEFSTNDGREQAARLAACCRLLRESCGITLQSFGAPFNADNADTAAALNSVGQLQVWMFPKHPAGAQQYLLRERVDMEPEAGRVSEAHFQSAFARCTAPYLVVQGHPPYWDATSRAAFVAVLDQLAARGCRFLTPWEFAQSGPASPAPAPEVP